MQIDVNEIDLYDLRNNTLVYVYFRQFGTSSIYAMNSSGRWTNVEYEFTFGDNSACCQGILIRLTTTDGTDLTEYQYSGSRGNRFRYVLVPANASTAKLNFSNYEAVKAFYNLPD